MTDLDHLKECYTEHRKELKRGYGVHSVGMCVDKKRVAEVASMVDSMSFCTENRFNSVVRTELTDIMDNSFSVEFKSSLKAALSCATINQLLQLEQVIRRECRTFFR